MRSPDVFGPDAHCRGFLPAADEFAPGTQLADAVRAVEVRAGFMAALVALPQVADRLRSWLSETKQYAARPAVERGESPTFDVLSLLRDLGVRQPWWPWCSVELIHVFQRMGAFGIDDPVQAIPPQQAGVIAPPMAVALGVEEGETTDEVRARWKELNATVTAELDRADAAATEKGKMPREDRAYLRRWGRWYVEARIRRPPRKITAIAMENHTTEQHPRPFEECDCEKTIRDGIKAAGRLLNLALPAHGGPPPGK